MSNSTSLYLSREALIDHWKVTSPYAAPPIAASMAIVPVYYGYVAKSALQTNKSIPRMSTLSWLFAGAKASPTVGAIVGTQMIAQRLLEKRLHRNKSASDSDLPLVLFSTVVVGTVSAPLLAIFNGQTMGKTSRESVRALSIRQTGAIVTRETGFLLGLRLSGPIANAMQRGERESKVVEFAAAFFSGSMGSLVGHPADTLLTLWQRGERLDKWSHLMRGSAHKAVAAGIFTIFYKVICQSLEVKSEDS